MTIRYCNGLSEMIKILSEIIDSTYMKTKKGAFSIVVTKLFVALVLLFAGCEQDYYQPELQKGSGSSLFGDSINVPEGFDWSTMQTVDLNLEVDDQYNGKYFYTVELYGAHPFFDEKAPMLGKGVARKGNNFNFSATLPADLETIFIKQIDPTGREKVTATTMGETPNIVASFATGKSSFRSSSVDHNPSVASAAAYAPSLRSVPANVQTNYTTPADAIVINEQTPSSFTLQTNRSYVVRGEYTGALTFPGGGKVDLFIEGVWNNTSSVITLQKDSKMIVQNGGVFTTTVDLVVNGYNFVIVAVAPTGEWNNNKGADITFNFTDDGQIVNAGVLNAFRIQLPSKGVLYNAGEMEVEEFRVNSTNNITNDKRLWIADANFTNGEIRNNCLLVIESLQTNGTTIVVSEGSMITVDTYSTAMGTTILMDSHSILEITNSITFGSWSNTIDGVGGNAALLRMEEIHFNGWHSVRLQGKLELENSNYTSTQGSNGYQLVAPASWVQKGASTVIIGSTDCNGGGNNVPAPETPPTNPIFPVIWNGTDVTYLFEDNWPQLGDYDMNDVVLNVTPTYLMNAANKVEQLQLEVTLRAVGGVKRLAVGLQIDGMLRGVVHNLSRSNLTGRDNTVFIASNGLETGQTYAVIPLFDDVHHALGIPPRTMVNTVEGGAAGTVPPLVVNISIDFATPVNPEEVSIDRLNPFIVNGGYLHRRDEVHMPGFAPTEIADPRKFGAADDDSNRKYFTSKGNLIWALAIPGETPYPKEYTSIRKAYPDLEEWATSAGAQAKDWYRRPEQSSIYNPR